MLRMKCDRGQALRRRGAIVLGRLDVGGARGDVEPDTRLSEVDDDQSDHQGEIRDGLEIDGGPQPDPPDLLHLADLRQADDDRGEDDRPDQHANQLDEAVAERAHRGAGLGPDQPDARCRARSRRGPAHRGCDREGACWARDSTSGLLGTPNRDNSQLPTPNSQGTPRRCVPESFGSWELEVGN